MSPRPNSLQAVLQREAAIAPPEPPPPPSPTPSASAKAPSSRRPSRDGRRFLGGHFEPHVVKQMKLLAAEEETTIQALLEEAVDLLFVRKGRGRIVSG